MGTGTSLNFIEEVMPDGVNYEDLPEIKHQYDFVGSTDYLDGIFPEHLTHYVMRGKDQFDRIYIIIYYKKNIQTFFQRYTGHREGTWSYGKFEGGKFEDMIVPGCGNIAAQPESMANIKEVMTELLKSNEIPEEILNELKDKNEDEIKSSQTEKNTQMSKPEKTEQLQGQDDQKTQLLER